MSREVAKGSRFEHDVADFLESRVGLGYIERRAKTGAADRGDISGVRLPDGGRVVVECKSCARYELAQWLGEARVEAANDGAEVGVVVFKRRGIGRARMGEQFVLMSLEDLARLLTARKDAYRGR